MKRMIPLLFALCVLLAGCARGFGFEGEGMTESEFAARREKERDVLAAGGLLDETLPLTRSKEVSALRAVIDGLGYSTADLRAERARLAELESYLSLCAEQVQAFLAETAALSVRYERGEDVAAECGELLARSEQMRETDRAELSGQRADLLRWQAYPYGELTALLARLERFGAPEAWSGLSAELAWLTAEMKRLNHPLLADYSRLYNLADTVKAMADMRADIEARCAALAERPQPTCRRAEIAALIAEIGDMSAKDKAELAPLAEALRVLDGELLAISKKIARVAEWCGALKNAALSELDAATYEKIAACLAWTETLAAEDADILAAERAYLRELLRNRDGEV